MKPLDGVRIIEVASWIMVPAACAILAEWGAEVIKIEHAEYGDPMRGLNSGPIYGGSATSQQPFEHCNRGKRSVGLNLKDPRGIAILNRMIKQADVFVTNLLPNDRQALGIDQARVTEVNPNIVYASGSGLGQRGDEANRPAYDSSAFWARSGLAEIFRHPELRYPVLPPPGFGDLVASMALAAGICAGLRPHDAGRSAPAIDISLLGVATWLNAMGFSEHGEIAPVTKSRHEEVLNPLVNHYRTSDGETLLLGGIQYRRDWPLIAEVIGQSELGDDSRFVTEEAWRANRRACIEILDEAFAQRPLAEWAKLLDTTGIVWEAVRRPEQLLTDPQVLANDYLNFAEANYGVRLHQAKSPAQFGRVDPEFTMAPAHAADTELVLIELADLDWPELAQLKDDGVIT